MALSAIVAAVYATLTLFLPIPQYGGVQLRVAEALTLLPFLLPEATLGLTVGCFLANLLGSPYMLDWVFGTLATFLATVLTRRMPNKYLAAVPPILSNALIIGAEIAYFSVLDGAAFAPAFAFNALTVGLGEAIACFALGVPLIGWMQKNPYLRDFFVKRR